MPLEVFFTGDDNLAPEYKTPLSAGADLKANISEPLILKKGEYLLIPTGLFFEIPAGYEGQVRPRSGLAAKHGITVLNSPGTIDADYRGEVKVILINHGDKDFKINPHDRIAQLIIAPVHQAVFMKSGNLNSTERGGGGFGSTGIH